MPKPLLPSGQNEDIQNKIIGQAPNQYLLNKSTWAKD